MLYFQPAEPSQIFLLAQRHIGYMTSKGILELELPDLSATDRCATQLAQTLQPGTCIYFNGNLGAGKTTFIRALLRSLGITGTIKSPTFALVETYNLPAFDINHFDLYRLDDPQELEHLGIRDYAASNAVCVFEWAEKGVGKIPAADLEISLEIAGEGRHATFIAHSALGTEVLAHIKG